MAPSVYEYIALLQLALLHLTNPCWSGVQAAFFPVSGDGGDGGDANGAVSGGRCSVEIGLCTALPVVQIAWSHTCEFSSTGCIGSPNIIRTGPSSLLASNDIYRLLPEGGHGTVYIHASNDDGGSWSWVANVTNMYWAEFLNVSSTVYLFGVSADISGNASITISKCLDTPCSGKVWSTPTVLVAAGGSAVRNYHSSGAGWAVSKEGVMFRALEVHGTAEQNGGCKRSNTASGNNIATDLSPFLMSVSTTSCADLTSASCWHQSPSLCYDEKWRSLGGVTIPMNASHWRPWEEATVFATPDGDVKVLMRLDSPGLGKKCNEAVLLDVTTDGDGDGDGTGAGDIGLSFNQTISFPSGSSRFVVRYHGASGRYYSLTNVVDANRVNNGSSPDPCGQRNVLILTTSSDLITWETCGTPVLWDDSGNAHAKHIADASFLMTGFQYTHWQFDGDDLICATRAAYRGASDAGQANRLLFTRVRNFEDKCKTNANKTQTQTTQKKTQTQTQTQTQTMAK